MMAMQQQGPMHQMPDGSMMPGEQHGEQMAKGGMIKRADGSYSKRGLWDNIRANRGSGKKPTKQMLAQEKKIKKKAYGGDIDMYHSGGEIGHTHMYNEPDPNTHPAYKKSTKKQTYLELLEEYREARSAQAKAADPAWSGGFFGDEDKDLSKDKDFQQKLAWSKEVRKKMSPELQKYYDDNVKLDKGHVLETYGNPSTPFQTYNPNPFNGEILKSKAYGGRINRYADGGPTDPTMDLMMKNFMTKKNGFGPYEKEMTGWTQQEWDQHSADAASGETMMRQRMLEPNKGPTMEDLPGAIDMPNIYNHEYKFGQYQPKETTVDPFAGIEDPTKMEYINDGDGNIVIEDLTPKSPVNNTLKNLYSAAKSAMVTAPFGYDYGPTDYYQSVYNPAEEQALGNLSEMEKQIAQARALAMEDTSIDTKDQRMAIEKARQRNLRSGATGPEKFALDQMANANAKDSMMQVAGQKARQETMLNSGAAKSARLAPLANAQAQLAQSRFGIGADRSGQDRYTKDAGLKTDAAMNTLEMAKLSNMSKWAQMQQLMGNKQGMDERSFQAMMNMYSDPAIREMYGNIG
jgi:hypothetical protein